MWLKIQTHVEDLAITPPFIVSWECLGEPHQTFIYTWLLLTTLWVGYCSPLHALQPGSAEDIPFTLRKCSAWMLLKAGSKLRSLEQWLAEKQKIKNNSFPYYFPARLLEPRPQNNPAYWPNSNMPAQRFPRFTQDLSQRLLQVRGPVNIQKNWSQTVTI